LGLITKQYIAEVRLRREDVPSFEAYPFSLPAVRNLEVLKLHPQVTFFVGENGSGKSTLLEAVAVAWGFNAEGGTKNFRFGTHRSHSDLEQYLTLSKGFRQPKDGFFLRAESFFNVATEIDRLDVAHAYGGKSLHEQSHGESFVALLMNRFSGKGLYILDEPEAALSPQRQLSALARIHDLVMEESQFIIATHSPILMAYPNAVIYACSEEGIREVDYYETEHYQVMHDFLANPKRMLDVLLDSAK
jgi:predicted ATPase